MKPNLRIEHRTKKCRSCNLCMETFRPKTVFDRYCAKCKEKKEILKFSDWLPDLAIELTEQLPVSHHQYA